MSDINEWDIVAGNNNDAPPDGAPEGQTPASLNNCVREVMAAIRRYYNDSEFRDRNEGATVSRVSDTVFRVAGTDYTSIYAAGRRVRISKAAGVDPQDGFVDSSVFTGGNTDVTVTLDSGVVDAATALAKIHGHVSLKSAAFREVGTGATQLPTNADISIGSNLDLFINRVFEHWQRGTTISSPVDAYTADMWKGSVGTGGSPAGTAARVALAAAAVEDVKYEYVHTQTAAASTTKPFLKARIPNVRHFAGKSITVSFYAKVSSGLNVDFNWRQHFGTGGSPSADVSGTPVSVALTTSWQRITQTIAVPSISGKGIGTSKDYFEISIEMPLATTFTAHFAAFQIDESTSAGLFVHPNSAKDFMECQRFYWKTFERDTAPAQGTTSRGALYNRSSASGSLLLSVNFPVKMDGEPVVTTYSTTNGDDDWTTTSTSASVAALVSNESDSGFNVQSAAAGAASSAHNIQAAAAYEL